MIITDPNQIDLTGADVKYKRNLRRFKVFTANQLIELEDTAFLSTFKVYKVIGVNSNNEPELVELVQNAKWSVDEETCYDLTAISKAKARAIYDPAYSQSTWDHVLINKFYMNDTHDEISINGEYEIAISYNGLELECSAISQDSIGPDYSPGLMRSLLYKVDELIKVRNPINNVFADPIGLIHCLEEDLTGHKRDNYISNEIHIVSSTSNLVVIRPQCGSFYNTTSLELKFQSNDLNAATSTLIKDEDYVVTGLNKEKTSISEPSCGVYEYIVLKRSLVGKIFLSYQAFGGEVTQADINTIKEALQNVYRVVSATDIVTMANINSVEIIRNLITRQDLIEHKVGHYQAQSFSYITDLSDKWANIAFIDRNPWSEDAPVPTACVGEFRIKIPDMYFFMDIKISFDLNAANDDQILNISVYHCESPSFDKNFLDYFIKRILPKFRLIWIKNSVNKGIMLQMSITSQESTTINVTIEDMTGVKSPWYLIDSIGAPRPSGYTNDYVDYGDCIDVSDGISTSPQYEFMWRAGNEQSNIVALYPQGYTVFAGNIPIEEIESESINYTDPEFGDIPSMLTGYNISPIITGSDIDLNQVKSVEFTVFDRIKQKYIIGRSQKINCQNNVLSAEALYFIDDLCLISCMIDHTTEKYTMKLFTRTGTNSLVSHRFDLVKIDLIN